MTKQELHDKKMALAAEADVILKRVADEKRYDMRGDEQAKFDSLHTEIEQISGLLTRMTKQEALATPEERKTEPTQPSVTGRPMAGSISDRDRAEAFRAWCLAGSKRANLSDEQRATARRVGLDLEANEIDLIFQAPTQLRSLDLTTRAAWAAETRAALTGAQSTTTTGGYTVADGAMQALEIALLQFGAMRQVATVYRTATGGPLPFPTTNDTTNKGRLLGENTPATQTEMTFGQLVLDAYKYSSDYILASVEFVQDSSIDVGAFIGRALGERIGRLQNDHFTTGTGSSQPNGIVTAATSSSVTFSGTATVTYDNLVDLVHTVDPAYRTNGRFMFHDGALRMLKKVKILQYSGDTVGAPLWQPSMTIGQPDTIMGYPYTVNQSMTTPATTVRSILFGDFSKYLIRDVREVTLLRLDERFAEQHSIAFLAFARADGDLLDAGTRPVKYGTQA